MISAAARTVCLIAIFSSLGGVASAQNPDAGWRKIAGTVIDAGLVSPASGPVRALWYAGSGRLLAQTASGRVFETNDFLHWRLSTTDALPSAPTNGSAFSSHLEIGGGATALAVSPGNAQDISVANGFGIWRSLDGGFSWRGLNEDLPNLLVTKLLDRRTAVLADGSVVEDRAGTWTAVPGNDPEFALRARFEQTTHRNVSAATQSGTTAYAGTADGHLLVSLDNGATWNDAPSRAGGAITRIWLDGDRTSVALAAAGSQLLRTVNGGLFWDDVSGSLPRTQIHGIAADRSAGVVYLATDRGVLEGSVPLNDAGPALNEWKSVSGELPAATAWDIRLNLDNTLTVALDGYGVFEAAAPHRARTVRIVNGADMSERAAAPGSLISVLNASVLTARPAQLGGAPSWPVIAASGRNSQLQVPFEATPGGFALALQGAGEQWTVPLTVKNAAPAIFVDSEGAPLVLDAASGLVMDPKVAVHAGSTVQVLATGLGKVTPDWPTGVPAPPDSPPVVAAPVLAFLDGSPVTVTKATLAPGYIGYYIVELQIPAIVNRGVNELRIVMNNEESNRVKLYLESDQAVQ
jgi:uncharacterized protein (TIGR03437 family)